MANSWTPTPRFTLIFDEMRYPRAGEYYIRSDEPGHLNYCHYDHIEAWWSRAPDCYAVYKRIEDLP